jgi:SAM-dependent methyltransferase
VIYRKYLGILRNRMMREEFLPSWVSCFTSPLFILRSALKDGIIQYADEMQGRVLDFGCGSKPYESLFGRSSEYVGVDILTAGYDHTNSKVDVFWDGVHLPFGDSSFDSCVSTEVLEHVADTDLVLRELQRVMVSGGSLLVSTPFFFREHIVPYDFYRFTSFGLAAVLERNGFELVSVRKTSHHRGVLSLLAIEYLAAKFRIVDELANKLKIPARLGSLLFAPLLAGLNFFGSRPSRSSDENEKEVYINLIVLAKKRLEPTK